MFKVIWDRIYGSTTAVFESAYDLEESVRRLQAAAVSSTWPSIIKKVMYGNVSIKRVDLCRLPRRFSLEFDLEPDFQGFFQQTQQGVILVGKFSLSLNRKIGTSFSICLLLPFAIFFGCIDTGDNIWWSIVPTLLIIFSIFYKLYYRAKLPSEDIHWLTKKISEALSAPE